MLINAKLKNKDDLIYKYIEYIKGKMLIAKISKVDIFLNIIVKPIIKNKIK